MMRTGGHSHPHKGSNLVPYNVGNWCHVIWQFTVLAVLGRRPAGEPHPPGADTMTAVETALRVVPFRGWTQGMFGRRDRCLLVLSQLAGVPFKDLALLTAGMVTVAGGVVTLSAAGATTLIANDDPVVCGPCAITRWLRVLDVVMTKPSHRVLAKQIDDAELSAMFHRTCAGQPGNCPR